MDKAKSAPIKILGSKEDNYKILTISPKLSSVEFNMSPNAIPNPRSADDQHASAEAIKHMENYIPPNSQPKVTATNKKELEKKPEEKQEKEPEEKKEEPDVINGDDYLLWDLDL